MTPKTKSTTGGKGYSIPDDLKIKQKRLEKIKKIKKELEEREQKENPGKEIDEQKKIIVGVNKYQDKHDVEPLLNVMDPEFEKKQVARLKELKMKRDKNKVEHAIELLVNNSEQDNQNLMPHIINAVKNRVTLGEISDAFQSVFGRYEPRISF